MAKGYCTLEDLRRALREADLPGDAEQDRQIALDAITAQTEWLEKSLKRHFYVSGGIQEDTDDIIPTAVKTRDDEYGIPTASMFVAGDAPIPKTSQGDYAKIDLARRDADAVNSLHVRNEDGTYVDWVASSDYTEGSWPPSGEDYYLRVNNGGYSRLYIDTTNLLVDPTEPEEGYVLDSFANAVYSEFAYGHEGLPQTVRRAVAFRSAGELIEEPAFQIPDNVQIRSVESKAEEFRQRAEELLEVYR